MKNLVYSLFALSILSIVFFACGNNTMQSNKSNIDSTKVLTDTTKINADTSSSQSSCDNETIMDPNNPKPMALLMRALVANADTIKSKLMSGKTVNSTQFPLIKFWLVEPTNPEVLEPKFFENARLFSESYKQIFLTNENATQIKAFNAVIGKCINCHESYCSGPLKRIRKLPI